MNNFEPLSNIWDIYQNKIENAIKNPESKNTEDIDGLIWPKYLYLAESEKENLDIFVVDRTNEIISYFQEYNFNPKIIAAYIFRSILAAMEWERQRVGE